MFWKKGFYPQFFVDNPWKTVGKLWTIVENSPITYPLHHPLFPRIISPMSLKIEEVQHIAKLAKLDLSDDEIARYREQLSDILAHIEKLNELDTADISPMANALRGASPLRADEVRDSLPTKKLLQNAPDAEKNQFKVPAVFGEKKK